MSRLGPSVVAVLAVLAVLGLLLPPTSVCHAHEDGHRAHAHAIEQTVHVVVPHSHAHDADHSHRHEPAAPAPTDEHQDGPGDRDAPESHIHASDGAEAIVQSSGPWYAGNPADLAVAAIFSLACWPALDTAPHGPVPRTDVASTACSRPKDRLVLLGSLLF